MSSHLKPREHYNLGATVYRPAGRDGFLTTRGSDCRDIESDNQITQRRRRSQVLRHCLEGVERSPEHRPPGAVERPARVAGLR